MNAFEKDLTPNTAGEMQRASQDALAELAQKHEKHSPSFLDTLKSLPKLAQNFTSAPSSETARCILQTLDRLRSILLPLDEKQQKEILIEARAQSKTLWNNHRWDAFDFTNPMHHESNTADAHIRTGIDVDQVLARGRKQKPTDAIRTRILAIVAIYGLDRDTVIQVDQFARQKR